MSAIFLCTSCTNEHVDLARNIVTQLKIDTKTITGITLIDDVLILRVLGDSTEKLQAIMVPVWEILRPEILNKEAVKPRIWAT